MHNLLLVGNNMIWLARFLRVIAKTRFRLLGLATIKDIPGAKFEEIMTVLVNDGWRLTSKYSGFDAGIDYDYHQMRRGLTKLTCEWDNWSEWSIEGPRHAVEALAKQAGREVVYEWRWTEYD